MLILLTFLIEVSSPLLSIHREWHKALNFASCSLATLNEDRLSGREQLSISPIGGSVVTPVQRGEKRGGEVKTSCKAPAMNVIFDRSGRG